MNTTSLNSRERKAQRLLAHYATCDRLARYLATKQPSEDHFEYAVRKAGADRSGQNMGIDGKKISVALFKAERLGQQQAERLCSDRLYMGIDQARDRVQILTLVRQALGTLPPGFFVNSDPRGYALKIDNETEAGRNLINHAGLPTDMGGYGILSPEINGDR